jgi:hypothetical protein
MTHQSIFYFLHSLFRYCLHQRFHVKLFFKNVDGPNIDTGEPIILRNEE